MKLIYTICLILGAFFALAGLAWAGFNYESLGNQFLIDSSFKSGGNYIMVGTALNSSLVTEGPTNGITNPTSNFFAVTNNIIFSGDNAKFCTITGQSGDDTCTGRQIQKIGNYFNFKTPSISINNTQKFFIFPLSGRDGYNLTLTAPRITANRKFVLNNTSFIINTLNNNVTPIANSVYAPSIVANEIRRYDNSQYIEIDPSTQVLLTPKARAKQLRTITITAATINQPVAIILPADLLTGEKMRLDGWDLNFYSTQPSSEVPNPSSALPFFIDIMPKVWVKMPASGTITIFMTYGGTAPSTNPSNPIGVFGSDNVLGDANIMASFNFDEPATVTDILDSTIFGPGGKVVPVADVASIRQVYGKINTGITTIHDQYINLNASIPLNTEWTVEAWIMTPPNPGSIYNILARGATDAIIGAVDHGDGRYLGTWSGPPKPSGWNACDTNLSAPHLQGFNLHKNKLTEGWHHLFAVGKNGTTQFYLDGALKCTSAYQSQDPILYLGNSSEGKRSWGTFDEFRAYNKALSADTIAKLGANCSYTTLALPGYVFVKTCFDPIATVSEAEYCIENPVSKCADAAAYAAGMVTYAHAITYTQSGTATEKSFCQVKTWDAAADKSAYGFNLATPIVKLDAADPCVDTQTNTSRRTCCENNYYVFDYDANAGKMVCCRYNPLAPAQ